jgi:hypothetical protein
MLLDLDPLPGPADPDPYPSTKCKAKLNFNIVPEMLKIITRKVKQCRKIAHVLKYYRGLLSVATFSQIQEIVFKCQIFSLQGRRLLL